MTRANVRANQLDTMFGRLWNVINPLLMGMVYFLLVAILARGATIPHYFVYLLSGLFIFDVLETSMKEGARSVTGAGKMVTIRPPEGTAALSAVRGALAELWPSLCVLVVVALLFGVRPQWTWLLCIPVFALHRFRRWYGDAVGDHAGVLPRYPQLPAVLPAAVVLRVTGVVDG